MISGFRDFAKSKWAIALFALLIISFAIVGGTQTDVFGGLGPRNVIEAGERSLTPVQFRADFDRIRNNLQQEQGRPVTLEDLVAENAHVQYLESQTRRLGFLNWAHQVGIRVDESLVLDRIREIPAFFDQITGRFDEATYQRMLAEQSITPVQLEDEFRDTAVSEHFAAAIAAGLRAPRIYGALVAARAFEVRDGSWFSVTQAMAGTTAPPTEAQLTAFLNENAEQLRRPEFRIASVIVFSDAPDATPPAVAEARIVERFEFRREALSTPERRTFTTLTVADRAAAERIASALRAGQSPDAVAGANNIEAVPYADQPRSAVADPAIAAAVFALAADAVSAPVQGRVGFTVAKVTTIAPGQTATLESVRDAVIQELQLEDARARVFERVEAYEKARSDGKTLAQAVAEVGARIVQLPPFTQDGRLPDGQPLNAPPQILENTWALAQGAESEVVDAGQGQYFVVRLDQIQAAALPALAEVREPLAQRWTQRETARRLTALAEQLAARVRGGEAIAAVAASAGATVITRTGVQQNAESQTDLGEGTLQGLFGQGRGQVFTGPASDTSYVVGRVDAVRAANPATSAPLADQIRPRISQEFVGGIGELLVGAAATRSGAESDPALALEALGIDAPATTPAAATPSAPAQ
jgi:peptidyl-prolyl cis-trans isomerase D